MSKTDTKSTEVVKADKPLTATQARNLEKIIAGDFANLQEALSIEVEEHKQTRLAEIAKKYDPEKLEKAQEEAVALHRKLQDQAAAGMAKIAKKYGTSTTSQRYRGHNALVVTLNTEYIEFVGKGEAEATLNTAAAVLHNKARAVLDREQRTASRDVLLATLTAPDALALVEGMPSMDDVLRAVQQEVGNDDTSLKALGMGA